MQRRLLLLVGLVVVSVLSSAPEVRAQEDPDAEPPPTARPGIEEIVVQAGESDAVADLQSADSVTGFDASDLEALGAQSIEDLAGFTPNLEIVTTGSTTPTFFIRGVGLNDFNANSTGAVAVYNDDVPKNSPALQLGTLFDMEAVNVLRGPQGTGPARNASAGAIKLYSRKPSGEYGGYLRADYGRFNHLDYEGAVEMPLYEDILSSRVSFRLSKRDGYVTNRCGNPPLTDQPFTGVRFETRNKPFSLCGEAVRKDAPFGDAFSPIGLPYPAQPRVTYQELEDKLNDRNSWAARGVFQFRPTLDTDFLFIAHGARRDELSRVGQSYGTRQSPTDPLCTPTPQDDCKRRGALGGVNGDAEGYVPVEVQNLQKDLLAEGQSTDQAAFTIANELARNLDAKPYSGDYNRTGKTNNDVYGVSLKGDIALGDSLMVTSVSGYDVYDRRIDVDLDFSPNPLFEADTKDSGWQFAQDLSLSGAAPGEIPITWTLGAFGLAEQIDANIENRFPIRYSNNAITGREYTQDLLSLAGYGSFAWDFWKDFTLDGGVRYNWETREMDLVQYRGQSFPRLNLDGSYTAAPRIVIDSSQIPSLDQRRIFQDPTGTIRLTYRFREDTHAFWKYSRGWKSGHFNATAGNRGITIAEPEKIDAFEAGLRGSWFTGRFNLNASVFHYNYENYQIFTVVFPLNGNPEFVVVNANDAVVYGAEVDSVFRPLPGMFLQARFSWLESHFIDFVQTQATQQQTGVGTSTVFLQEIDNSGNRLLNSPQFKVSLTAEQTIPLGRYGSLTARWDGAWTDDTYFDATEGRGIPNFDGEQFLPELTIGQASYWLHNVRLGYRTPDGTVEIAGWIRNLTDEVYKTFAFDGSALETTRTTIYFLGEPRTYGLSLSVFF